MFCGSTFKSVYSSSEFTVVMEIFLNPLKLTLSNIYQLCGTSSPFSHTETFPRLIYFFILKTHHLGDLDTQMNRVGCQGDIGVKSLNGLTCIAHLQKLSGWLWGWLPRFWCDLANLYSSRWISRRSVLDIASKKCRKRSLSLKMLG